MRNILSKEKIKWLNSLKLKKNRQNEQLFVVEGVKIVDELLAQATVSQFVIKNIYAVSAWIDARASRPELQALRPLITEITEHDLQQISDLHSPNQVLVVLAMPSLELEPDKISSAGFYLALDTLQDPGNLGTILRIADWFGISDVFCSKGCAELYNSKVLQATMGSFLRVSVWQDIDLKAVLSNFSQRMPIYGAVLDGRNLLTAPPQEKRGVLLIGNESQGIHAELQALLTHRLTIPRFGAAESLNAAVATGILCSHFKV